MILFIFSLVLTFLLTLLVSGNNLSAAVGTLIGSRIVGRYAGVLIGSTGFFLGLILEGRFLHGAALSLVPHSYFYITYAFLISFLIFLFANIGRAPLSLTMALAGTALGIDIRIGYSIDYRFVMLMVAFWVIAPVISVIASYLTERGFFHRNFKNVWNVARWLKFLIVISSFLTAFTLGANTLGFIANVEGFHLVTIIVMTVAIFAGSFFLSSGVIKRVGEEMYSMRYSNALVSLVSFLPPG
ncbi:inorganic phosphate transporter [Ferroplasma sp. Type II]|uniref:inorganic phosphate transporter n=1 Tax=Ferroplasma sp. Type II TaxID=261388 RepID=UPI0025C2AB92|nr:inorganic phosphate transporter [Ferroplasma sp. Type II]